ncbi:ribonuclease E inhibitor RraB [Arthrobacter sp. NPDC057009]|uniref:ribonuclease E inhibitor RraB n=1 Tax=Arthrobacter sp. NPDC057009 TaxID=3345996 RepID=UPI003645BF9D
MTDPLDKLIDPTELSAKQIEQRLEIGDDLESSRLVDHSAVFPHLEGASQAAEELAAAGYSAEVLEEEDYFLLEAQQMSPLDSNSVKQFVQEVSFIVERHGGDYDGWGAEVMEAPRMAGARRPSWLKRLFSGR